MQLADEYLRLPSKKIALVYLAFHHHKTRADDKATAAANLIRAFDSKPRNSFEGRGEHGLPVRRIPDFAKTGYKIFERYEECGLEGLTDRVRRLHRYANQLPEQIEAAIVAAEREKPSWGARKLRESLRGRSPSEVKVPARSTIHAILDRHGLVTRRKRSRTRTEGTPLSVGLTLMSCPAPTIRASLNWAITSVAIH